MTGEIGTASTGPVDPTNPAAPTGGAPAGEGVGINAAGELVDAAGNVVDPTATTLQPWIGRHSGSGRESVTLI